MLDAGTMTDIRVWVMKPKQLQAATTTTRAVYSFPWNWNDWIEHKRLKPEAHRSLPGALGSAEFTLLRNTISDNNPRTKQPFTWDDATLPIVAGAYVCVTAGPLATVAPLGVLAYSTVRWFGFIDNINGDQLAGTTELVGSVTALELGHLLDRIPARGWRRNAAGGYGTVVQSPESANIGGQLDVQVQGLVIGNAVLGSDDSGAPTYLFQGDPSLCSTAAASVFTRWRLFLHFLRFGLNKSDILGGITWSPLCLDGSQADDPSGSTIAGYLNSTALPEVFAIANLSCKGVLDLVLPRPFAIGWTLGLVAGPTAYDPPRIAIAIYTLAESVRYGLPAFTSYAVAVDLSAWPTTNFHPHTTGSDAPDEVVVEGNRIVFGVTGGYADGNVGRGWNAAQETAYRTGAKDASGYGALTTLDQLDRNRQIRQGQALCDVFTRFVLQPATGTGIVGDLLRNTSTPGLGAGSAPMCPEVEIAADYSLAFNGTSRAPYLPSATLSRTLPWTEGSTPAGVDQRPDILRPWPALAKLKLFYSNPYADAGKRWLDLTARGGARSVPCIDVDDRGAALRITYDAPERLGYGIIVKDGGSLDGIYDVSQATDFDEGVEGFDWTKLVVTFGIPSDQRISYSIRKPGLTASGDVRNSLKITDARYHLWIMHGGSILSVGADGEPVRVASGSGLNGAVVTRNDWPALIAHANRVAAFAFRTRGGFTWTGMRPDTPPPWARIGAAITTITEGAVAAGSNGVEAKTVHNTVVERVEMTYGDSPRLMVEADLPSPPNLAGGNANPSGGGSIGMVLGGTVAQAVQQVQGQVRDLQSKSARTPLVQSYTPGGSVTPPAWYFVVGAITLPGFRVLGINRRADEVEASEFGPGTGGAPGDTVLVSAWPPTEDLLAALPSEGGVGIGQHWKTGEYVFLLCDSGSPPADLCMGQRAYPSPESVTFDVEDGGVTYRYICWRVAAVF